MAGKEHVNNHVQMLSGRLLEFFLDRKSKLAQRMQVFTSFFTLWAGCGSRPAALATVNCPECAQMHSYPILSLQSLA